MKQFIEKNRKVIIGFIAVLTIGGITMSFQDSPFVNLGFAQQEPGGNDTIPERKQESSMRMKDYDRLMNDLDKTVLEEVRNHLKNIDLDYINKAVENSLNKLNMEKILREVEGSLKNIDMEKIMKEVRSSLTDVEWKKHNGEINEAMEEASKEIEKAKAEIRDIDMKSIRKELEKARIEIEKSKSALKEIDIDKILNEARSGMNEAKAALRQNKEMFYEMEKDGFSIEYKDRSLYINGNKQPEMVADKYRKYIKGDHFKITIDKE